MTKKKLSPALSPQELYAACFDREKKSEASVYRRAVDLMLEDLLFAHPLFEDAHLAGWQPYDRLQRGRYPFNFSIAPSGRLSVPRREWQYLKLLETLKKLQDLDLRHLLIARWLQQEGVCQPTQFLTDDVHRRLIKRFNKHRPISPNDLRIGAMVHTWVPYFENIRTELEARKHLTRALEEVGKLGYDPAAVGWVSKTRSTIQAVCGWLAKRKNWEARTLRNVYSRQYGQKKLSHPLAFPE